MPIANVNGVNIFYQIWGEGEPILFIHGIGVSSRIWEFQKKDISKEFKMIVYDLRGSGKSQKTPWVEHTADLMSEDLRCLLDFLKIDRIKLVGISLGAAIAMKFAIKYPNRVEKMILTGAFVDLDGILFFMSRHLSNLIGKILMTKFFGKLATKIMLPSSSHKEMLYYHSNIISIDKDEIKKYGQILNSYSITDAMEKISSPTLILYGVHEKILHKYGRIIKDKIKGSEMRIIEDVGHGWNGENPQLFNSIIINFMQ